MTDAMGWAGLTPLRTLSEATYGGSWPDLPALDNACNTAASAPTTSEPIQQGRDTLWAACTLGQPRDSLRGSLGAGVADQGDLPVRTLMGTGAHAAIPKPQPQQHQQDQGEPPVRTPMYAAISKPTQQQPSQQHLPSHHQQHSSLEPPIGSPGGDETDASASPPFPTLAPSLLFEGPCVPLLRMDAQQTSDEMLVDVRLGQQLTDEGLVCGPASSALPDNPVTTSSPAIATAQSFPPSGSSSSSSSSRRASSSRRSGGSRRGGSAKGSSSKSGGSRRKGKVKGDADDNPGVKRQRVRCFEEDAASAAEGNGGSSSSCKSVSAFGVLQCKGVNRKRKTRCRNAALMEYVGPRPLYCAEHIAFDPDALYHKCGLSISHPGEPTAAKKCKEVVYRDFKRCYKHMDVWLQEDFVGSGAIQNTQRCLETAVRLTARLETETSAAKSVDQELYQRKSKLLPKYQTTAALLKKHLETLRSGRLGRQGVQQSA